MRFVHHLGNKPRCWRRTRLWATLVELVEPRVRVHLLSLMSRRANDCPCKPDFLILLYKHLRKNVKRDFLQPAPKYAMSAHNAFSSAHRLYVKSLYKRYLTNSLDWCINRPLWREQALLIRADFEKNRYVHSFGRAHFF